MCVCEKHQQIWYFVVVPTPLRIYIAIQVPQAPSPQKENEEGKKKTTVAPESKFSESKANSLCLAWWGRMAPLLLCKSMLDTSHNQTPVYDSTPIQHLGYALHETVMSFFTSSTCYYQNKHQ